MDKNIEEAGNCLTKRDYKAAIELYYKALAQEDGDKIFILNKIAQCYLALNNYDKAIYNYENIIQLDPQNIDSYLSLAKVLETINDRQQAIDTLKKALSLQPNNTTLLEYLLTLFIDNKEYVKAYDFLKTKLINLQPTSANYYLLGELSLIRNNTDDAFVYFTKSAEVNPNNVDAKVQITKILFARQEFETARKYIVDIFLLDSENLEAHKLLGQIFIERKDYHLAIDEFNQVLIKDAKDTEASYYLAYSYSMLKQHKLAIDILSNALSVNPENIELKTALAYNYFSIKENKKALNIAENIIYKDPQNQEILRLLADIYMEIKKYPLALDALNSLLDENKKDSYALYKKGVILSILGLETDALTCFKKSIAEDKGTISTLLAIANLELKRKKYKKAQEFYNQVLDKVADNYEALYGIAEIAFYKEEKANIIDKYLQLIKINPNETLAYYRLALTFYKEKNYDLALRYISEAVKLDKQNSNYQYLCAKILYELNLYKNSMEAYAKAVEFEPDNAKYLNEFADVLFLNQEIDKAITVAKRVLRIEPQNREAYAKLALFYEEKGLTKELIKILKKYLKTNNDPEFQAKIAQYSKKKD